MNSNQLIQKLSKNTHYNQNDIRIILHHLSYIIKTSLEKNEDVYLANIGKFEILNKAPCSGVINLGSHKGEKWYKPGRKEVSFKPAKALKELDFT